MPGCTSHKKYEIRSQFTVRLLTHTQVQSKHGCCLIDKDNKVISIFKHTTLCSILSLNKQENRTEWSVCLNKNEMVSKSEMMQPYSHAILYNRLPGYAPPKRKSKVGIQFTDTNSGKHTHIPLISIQNIMIVTQLM